MKTSQDERVEFTFNGSRYIVLQDGLSRGAAQEEAAALGGTLLRIDSQMELDWVMSNLWSGQAIYLDASDAGSEGMWTNSNGEALTYTNWSPGNPNNQGNQDYAVISGADGTWDDQDFNGSDIFKDGHWVASDAMTVVEISGDATKGGDSTTDNDGTTTKDNITTDSGTTTADGGTGDDTGSETGSDSDGTSRSHEFTFNGSRYIVLQDGLSRGAAQEEAAALGGTLLRVDSQAEQDWVMSNLWSGQAIYLDASDAGSEGMWTNSNGEALTYTNWSPGNPNNQGNQDYAVISGADGTWDDQDFNGSDIFKDGHWVASDAMTVVEISGDATKGGDSTTDNDGTTTKDNITTDSGTTTADGGTGDDTGSETGSDSDGTDGASSTLSGREQLVEDNMAVAGGRVTTLDTALDTNVSIEVTGKPGIGNLTVNPDNTLALVLTGTDYTGPLSFQYTATFEDGTSQVFDHTVDVQPLPHLKGWATGENIYMLETDAQGGLVVEHGDDHRTVHVSKDETALSRAEIAAKHGLEASEVTASWLLEHPEYGATPDLALNEELGSELWNKLTEDPGSHWLLLERGHDYDLNLVPYRVEVGESELHPLYVGAYGEGSAPRYTGQLALRNDQSNVAIEGIKFADGFTFLNANNVLLNDLAVDGHTVVLQGLRDPMEGITLRNSTIYDAIKDAPAGDDWSVGPDKIQGLFVKNTNGLLIEGVHVDHTGWEEGYSPDGDGDFGQAPSKMSQNIYIQFDNSDVTFRDNVSMRAAASGAQIRSGGFIEDNVLIDNNHALSANGGKTLTDGVRSGHFSLLSDNLVTSGGAKESDLSGSLTWGLTTKLPHATYLDNIVAHLADPNNPAEFEEKVGNSAYPGGSPSSYFNNSIVYNWVAQNYKAGRLEQNADQNVENVDPALADQTTIQNFTAALLGQQTATIDDLGQYLRTQFADGQPNDVTADDIIAYFQETFGIAPDERTSAETLRFVPNDLGDGVRWDNRINWTTEDLPGTVDGDSVDLGGNWVTFATITGTVDNLEFGSGGRLNVTSGRLNVEGETSVGADGGEIDISKAGQLWLTDYSDEDRLDIDVEGGRFANTGFFDGLLDMHVTGGQALVGVDDAVMELNQNSVLTIEGDEAKVGFDGETGGVSVLRMETGSQLRMVADENGFSTIEEFRSGAHDNDEPDVLSAFDMGEGTLLIDISAIAGGQAREEVLVDTDEIFGMFDDVEFVGLGDNQDATLTVDYENDRVTVSLSEANSGGTGQVDIVATGAMVTGMEDDEIWNTLTEGQNTYLEDNADIPDPGASKTPEDDELEAEAA